MNEFKESNNQQAYAELLKKADELSDKLFRVNQKLKESEALKGHFISNITNEIVNPFASILVIAESMQQLKEGQIDKAKEMASLIYEEAFHLDFQLKNIFAAASIEAGIDDLKPVDVNLVKLVEKSVTYFQSQIVQKQIEVNLTLQDKEEGELTNFFTDEEKLALIVKNLLDNAIKFSHENGTVEINLERKDDILHFSVRDYGKGIPIEKRKAIFDRFKQLDERINSMNTGHGLGLSIIKSYLDSLNGEIQLMDLEGEGTCFDIRLKEMDKEDDWDDMDQFLIGPKENF